MIWNLEWKNMNVMGDIYASPAYYVIYQASCSLWSQSLSTNWFPIYPLNLSNCKQLYLYLNFSFTFSNHRLFWNSFKIFNSMHFKKICQILVMVQILGELPCSITCPFYCRLYAVNKPIYDLMPKLSIYWPSQMKFDSASISDCNSSSSSSLLPSRLQSRHGSYFRLQ